MSTELPEPTAESVELSKTLAEMRSLDEHGTAEVCIYGAAVLSPDMHRSHSAAPTFLQRRGFVSLQMRLSRSRTSTWRLR